MNLEDYISEERLKIYETILKLKEEETIDAYTMTYCKHKDLYYQL